MSRPTTGRAARRFWIVCAWCADYLLSTAETIGVRESRRIVGEYQLPARRFAGAEFETDRALLPVDIHQLAGPAMPRCALSRPYDPTAASSWAQHPTCSWQVVRTAPTMAHGCPGHSTTMPLGEAPSAALCLQSETPRSSTEPAPDAQAGRRQTGDALNAPDTSPSRSTALCPSPTPARVPQHRRERHRRSDHPGLQQPLASDDTPPHWARAALTETEFDRSDCTLWGLDTQYVPVVSGYR
jgi:hypothetical protein